MRKLVWSVLFAAACSANSNDAEIPGIQAGPGIKVDGATHTVSIDDSTVPVASPCAAGALVRRGASGWECVASAPDSDSLGGRPASAYVTADGTAANASRLGGWPASAYVTSSWGVANDSARLGGLPATSYVTATAGTANDSSRFGGLLPADFVQSNLQTDIEAGAHRQVLAFTDAGGTPSRISAEGLFCGSSPATAGNVSAYDPATRRSATGYRAGKLLCEQVDGCGGATAHMCSASEMLRSAQLGMFGSRDLPPAWVSTGAGYLASTPTAALADCYGWSSASSQFKATVWQSIGGIASATTTACEQSMAIACCR